MPLSRPRRLLFLCTGNYYRSRFAETLWNHLELAQPIGWRADSRGLSLSLAAGNLGAMSLFALQALRARGVVLGDSLREPAQATAEDFAESSHVVAVSAIEHRGMMQERFPSWAEAVEYWDVEDVDLCEPRQAVQMLDAHVRMLRERLRDGGGPPPT